MTIEIQRDFEVGYRVEVGLDYPGADTHIRHYGEGRSPFGRLFLKCSPRGLDSWYGSFSNGDPREHGVTGVYAAPRPNLMIVVARGVGYWVDVCDLNACEVIDLSCIRHVIAMREMGQIVFADAWELMSYDSNGLKWRTGRLCLDGLSDVVWGDEFVEIECDTLEREGERMRVCLSSGEVVLRL